MPDGEGSTLVKMRCSPQSFGCRELSSDQQISKLGSLFLLSFHSSCNLSYIT